MGIGYLLLYVALAVVALWLLAELLLQNRAPLHWRVVALGGFLAVVAGMALGSVVVIGAGAVLFALGQVFVTLSVKRGYRDGWSLRRSDGALPGPLARVPLLSAATGGQDVAEAVAVQHVGEVGEVEAGEVTAAAFASPAFEVPAFEAPTYGSAPMVEQTAAFAMQEITGDGVYADAPVHYEQQQPAWDGGQQQWQPQPEQPVIPQQPVYDYQQGAWQQQQQ